MSQKQDYDDLETDYFDEEVGSSFLSVMSLGVAFLCVAVFIGLAWYAYQDDGSASSGEELVAIYPDEEPLRIAPDESDTSWKFPEEEREIYAADGRAAIDEVEQILPQPDAPEMRSNTPEIEGWVNKEKLDEVAVTAEGEVTLTDAERQLQIRQRKMEVLAQERAALQAPEVKVQAEEVVIAAPAEVKASAAEVKTPVAPKPVVKEVVVVEAKPILPESIIPVENNVAAIKTPKLTSNRLQLGAFTSRADALKNWSRISSKYDSVLAGKNVHVEEAMVKGKTYYRVQAYPFASAAEAKATCVLLSGKGQPCFAVK